MKPEIINNSSIDKLLECPFCGTVGVLVNQGWYPKNGGRQRTYQVRCTGCTMTDKYWSEDTPEEAIALWNTRCIK